MCYPIKIDKIIFHKIFFVERKGKSEYVKLHIRRLTLEMK